MTWQPPGSPHPGGGDSPSDDAAPLPPPVVLSSPDALASLDEAHDRIIHELDQGNLPPGTTANALSSLTKLAISRAEISLAAATRDPASSDPAAAERARARTDQLTELIELYLVRLLELNTEVARVFGELADALGSYTRDCEGARPLWRSLLLARATWNEAHGRDPATPYIPNGP